MLLATLGLFTGLAAMFLGIQLWERSELMTPGPTLYSTDRQGRFLGEIASPENKEVGYWSVDPLPERVVAATLALEDGRFDRHPGVDPAAVLRAFWQNLRSGHRVSGASTLAMQVARMQTPTPRTYLQKAMEAATALLLTWRHGRRQVLAHYLRIVPYGNRIHGIAYAARRYFDKPAEDLSWAEIAFLTAIPQTPARMNPYTLGGQQAAIRRGQWVLNRLYQSGRMKREEYELACQQIGSLRIPPFHARPLQSLHALLRLEKRLAEPEIRAALVRRPIVKSTLDLDLQEEVSWRVFESVWQHSAEGAVNGAVIVLDCPTNEVLAWVGSSDYFDSLRAGSIDYTDVPRSPGSALKPFFYALALERGVITPATILDDLERGAGGITNADDAFLGPLLPRMALANSRNVPAANLLNQIGLEEGFDFLRSLRLHDGRAPARQYGLGLSIGGMPVTLEQLVRAYSLFSREGLFGDLIWYQGQPHVESHRLLSEETARQLTLFLSDPLARLPSFPRLGPLEFPYSVAVKTGTSSRFRDAWTVAYSSRYLVGVWMGDPDFKPMNHLTGYKLSAEVARSVLDLLHQDQIHGLADYAFPPPRGYVSRRLCALSGQLAARMCSQVFEEWFRPGAEPAEYCRAHVLVAVDSRDGRPASPATPPAFVEEQLFIDLPPHYAEWMSRAGVPRLPVLAGPVPPGYGSAQPIIRLAVHSPENGLRLLRDPESPAESGTLALKAVADPPIPQLAWYVDGRPYKLVDYPYTARWKVQPGEHTFQVRIPQSPIASTSIRVWVQ